MGPVDEGRVEGETKRDGHVGSIAWGRKTNALRLARTTSGLPAGLGWLVHPIREDDMCAYLEIRETLELKALDLAKARLERSQLEQMLAGNPLTADGESPRLDNRLHQYLIQQSRNRFIESFFRQYAATYYTAVFDCAAPEAHVVAKVASQHRQILEALIAKRWVKARQALSDHIWAQRPILKRLLDTTQSGDCDSNHTPPESK